MRNLITKNKDLGEIYKAHLPLSAATSQKKSSNRVSHKAVVRLYAMPRALLSVAEQVGLPKVEAG